MSTDFFDDDLDVAGAQARKAEQPPGDEPTEIEVKPASDLNLDRLLKQKQELDGRVAGASQEIEDLRKRQQELESQKTRMEELARKQVDYEEAKREIIAQLDRSVILLEKDEVQASRLVDLLAETRQRFKESLNEVRGIDEQAWDDVQFEEELNRAIVSVDDARLLHQKGMAKVDVVSGHRKGRGVQRATETVLDDGPAATPVQGFGYWLKAGLGFSLPLITIAVILFVVYLFLIGLV